jgi:lipopolysaccharide/colanic/teichoic acid biosynthesis glycosyltransferase
VSLKGSGSVKRGVRYPKRLVDILLSALALVVLAPVIAAVAIVVRLKLGSPVFFVQERPGLGGRSFRLVKFRTMLDRVGSDGRPLEDADRLTPFGRWLRSTSLDELPELWNVLKGEMSLIGPRPLLMQYLPLYTPFQMRRHEVRPGITGWAQVNGRNALSWPEKFALDVWYVDHWSLGLDMLIVLRTLRSVAGQHGISAEGEATVPYFRGEADDGASRDNVMAPEPRRNGPV